VSTRVIEQLAMHILETDFDTLPKEAVEHAKYEIIDVVGCLIGGAKASGCEMVLDLVREWGGKKEACILVYGNSVPAHNAAMVNSIMTRSFDYEINSPYYASKRIPSHTSGTTVPTAFAMAELESLGGKELIAALTLGDDIASRILIASNYSLESGWDAVGTVNMFGATAIAGRILKLNLYEMLNSFGIVVNQLAGTFQSIYDGTHSFKLAQGLAARAGIFSARLASKGFTGVKDALFSKYGYFNMYCRTYNPGVLTEELGDKFYVDRLFKPYPGCMGNHGAIDCALQLVHGANINVEEVEEITVGVTPLILDLFVGQPFDPGEVAQATALFNIRYNIASILLRKEIKLEYFTDKFVREPQIMSLVGRIKLVPKMSPEKMLATDMSIKMKSGQQFNACVDVPKGDAVCSPLTRLEIKDKFRSNVAFSQTVKIENAEKALDMLENLEQVDSITDVVKLLIAE